MKGGQRRAAIDERVKSGLSNGRRIGLVIFWVEMGNGQKRATDHSPQFAQQCACLADVGQAQVCRQAWHTLRLERRAARVEGQQAYEFSKAVVLQPRAVTS